MRSLPCSLFRTCPALATDAQVLDKQPQESFKRVVATLVTRRNHWNDLHYRDDPTIMGWELANEPHMPGDDSGNVLKVRWPRAEGPSLMAGSLVIAEIPTSH